MEDHCVMCGAYVPEGTMVCARCMKKTQMEDKRYALLLSPEQAKLLSSACEFYARMMMGQWQELIFHTMTVKDHPKDYCEAREDAEQLLLEARAKVFPELIKSFGHSYGVHKFRDADLVWEIYEVVRHCIAWTEHPKGDITVDFGPPMSLSGEPLPECKFMGGSQKWRNKDG